MRNISRLIETQAFCGAKTYASWPVWAGSTRKPVEFPRRTRQQMVKLWHRARDFDRQTAQPGRHGGRLGRVALAVLHSLVFDFWNSSTGRLDPSLAAIAKAAGVCRRSAVNGLARLKAVGVLTWLRRCIEDYDQAGRFCLKQETNAYSLLPESAWHGYSAPPSMPRPHPGEWGAAPRLPGAMEAASQALAAGEDRRGVIAALATDPRDPLAAALARLGAAMTGRNP